MKRRVAVRVVERAGTGAQRHQKSHGIERLHLPSRPHQRSHPAAVLEVWVDAARYEVSNKCGVSELRGDVNAGASFGVPETWIGAGLHQLDASRQMALPSCPMEWRRVQFTADCIDNRAALKKEADDVPSIVYRGPMQQRDRFTVRLVHIPTGIDQLADSRNRAVLCGLNDVEAAVIELHWERRRLLRYERIDPIQLGTNTSGGARRLIHFE